MASPGPVTSAALYNNEILFERSYSQFYIRQLYTYKIIQLEESLRSKSHDKNPVPLW